MLSTPQAAEKHNIIMDKFEVLSEDNKPIDFPKHCEMNLLFALQLRSFQVKYPIFHNKTELLVENIFRKIFDSAIEAYAYFENKKLLPSVQDWSTNRGRLKANIGDKFFKTWKDFWRDSNTIVFVDKNKFKFEDFFRNCIDPDVLGNPGSIYNRNAWNFGREKAVADNLIGFLLSETGFAASGGVKEEYISIIGSDEEIAKIYKIAINHCRMSNSYAQQRKILKPGRFFKFIFDRKTCKSIGKNLNEGYGTRILSTIRQELHQKGYGELIESTFNTGGNFFNIAFNFSRLEEGLVSIKQVLKENLSAPGNTIIREYSLPNTLFNYSFCLDEKWAFYHTAIIE